MRKLRTIYAAIVVFFMLCLDGCCRGQAEEDGITPMLRAEQDALYSAIQGFVGNWWNGSDLYPDPCGWTPIQGVSCDLFDGFWYVTDLNIGPVHDNSLSCGQKVEFRPQFFQLNHLRTLSFFNCFTSLHHPMILPIYDWEKLASSLLSLEFRSNPALIGPVPTSFGTLEKLQSLVLLGNGFTGEIPTSMGNLANLKRLVLSGNTFTGQVPYSLGNLDQLLIMDLSRNSFSGVLPSTYGGLVSLLKLDLSNNLMVGPIPDEIANLKNLTLLDLRSNSFSGGLTTPFQKMESLEELALSHNPIGGDLHNIEWQNMGNLVFLGLSSSGLTGEVPESISETPRLRYLDLSNNNLSGNLPPKLETMPCVSALYVYGNNLTGELKFSNGFYEKMGRKFGAWGNPDLCYPGGFVPTNGHAPAPVGVKPCHDPEVTFHEPDSRSKKLVDGDGNQVQGLVLAPSSLGTSISTGEGIWWVSLFLLQSFMAVLMLNCYIS
ncbi:hypothetical protein Dimus_014757 [Dionaea muscipula]